MGIDLLLGAVGAVLSAIMVRRQYREETASGSLSSKSKARFVIMGVALWIGFMAVGEFGDRAMLSYTHAQEATSGQALKASHPS
ncbi:hypothetical protein HLH26_08550 [Gluconacetobacter sp. 1b LMG 1731]|uniref:Uncharacterized protein n=1 Tax=Gluconacetobacter dulcium TaxID=2729096 RepID=A0A7W4IKM0_9PROT|nr:hypothetical protein [Gluconacetobacter dulcium]MBB2164590.1 hypothetical protein [Gluconacetobacter dulcium]MBB2193643.1 hypothetical protein [Gluconacetobacter dulcium]